MVENNKQKQDELFAWYLIKHALYETGHTFGEMARTHRVHKSNFVLRKHIPSPRYEKIIGDLIGIAPWILWPHRYREDHQPAGISFRYRKEEFLAHRSRKIAERKQKNMEAAG